MRHSRDQRLPRSASDPDVLDSGILPSTIAYTDQANTFDSGTKQKVEHDSAGTAGLTITAGAGDPTTQANGDIWYNSTEGILKYRQEGRNVAFSGVDAVTSDPSSPIDGQMWLRTDL